ncbi:MAG TPA: MBOAT family O-acyltransferase [Solimonas sp.]|nr:MBOAT family O-acyltransferase [Solimonas sp.]
MLFNSYPFLCFFLPITLVVFFVLGRRWGSAIALGWVVVASLFFYAWWNPWQVWVLAVSLFGNFYLGKRVTQGEQRKRWLAIGVTLNIAVLLFFKYSNPTYHTLDHWLDLGWNWRHVIMPLGLSFYTFQQMAYLIDSYRAGESEPSFLRFTLFVTFFPHVIIGPIVHHREMLPQFADPKTFIPQLSNFNLGLPLFFLGLFKKVAIADPIGHLIDPTFTAAAAGHHLTLFEAWAAALGYTFQLYFDFSGYADMSIGIARLFGVQLPQNFDSPYKSRSMSELWRRWHITLMRFMREYFYIPLGGNRKGPTRQKINLFLTMIMCGLWHGDGAGWTFFVFGALHGVALIINMTWTRWRETHDVQLGSWWNVYAAWLLTFMTWCLGLVLFRAATVGTAADIWKGMAGFYGARLPDQVLAFVPALSQWIEPVRTLPYLAGGTVLGLIELMTLLVISAVLSLLCQNLQHVSQERRVALLIVTFAFAIQGALFAGVPAQFLYFQF